MKQDQEILFAYPKAINKKWLKKVCNQTGQPMGHVIDKMIESFRLSRAFEVAPKTTLKDKKLHNLKKKSAFTAVSNAKKGSSKH